MTKLTNTIIFLLIISLNINLSHQYIKVIGPKSILGKFQGKDQTLGKYSIANFGFVNYGHFIQAPVKVGNPYDACHKLQNIQTNDIKTHKKDFILLTRANQQCSILQQVLNAQEAGASMIIIGDDSREHEQKTIHVDHENGSQHIKIPTVFISHKYEEILYDSIKNLSKQNTRKEKINEVMLQIKFEVSKYNVASVTMMIDVTNISQMHFFQNFYMEYLNLSDKISITPIYEISSCKNCKKQIIQENCILDGKYCFFDPKTSEQVPGKMIMMEQFRQICIWGNYGYDDWLQYMYYFYENCQNPREYESCSEETQRIIFRSTQKMAKINTCLKTQSFLLESNQHRIASFSNLIEFPGLVINRQIYRGNLVSKNVMQAICSSLAHQPEECKQYDHFSKSEEDILNKIGFKDHDAGQEAFQRQTAKDKIKQANHTEFWWISLITVTCIFVFVFTCWLANKVYSKYKGYNVGGEPLLNELVSNYIQQYDNKETRVKSSSTEKQQDNSNSNNNVQESESTDNNIPQDKFKINLNH